MHDILLVFWLMMCLAANMDEPVCVCVYVCVYVCMYVLLRRNADA
jgi:hypothetical protein